MPTAQVPKHPIPMKGGRKEYLSSPARKNLTDRELGKSHILCLKISGPFGFPRGLAFDSPNCKMELRRTVTEQNYFTEKLNTKTHLDRLCDHRGSGVGPRLEPGWCPVPAAHTACRPRQAQLPTPAQQRGASASCQQTEFVPEPAPSGGRRSEQSAAQTHFYNSAHCNRQPERAELAYLDC